MSRRVAVTMVGYLSADVEAATAPLLRRWTPSDAVVEVLDNTVANRPLSEVWNAAIARVGADVHVLLNADVWVTPNWLDPLLRAFDDPKVAVAGPGANEGAQAVYVSGIQPSGDPPAVDLLIQAAGYVQGEYAGQIVDKEVFGFCYAVSVPIFQRTRGFDPGKFYGNEADYNTQVRDAGYRVVVVRNSYVWHKGRVSVAAKRAQRIAM